MAQDLTQNARATPPPFDATRNFTPPPSSMPAGPSSSLAGGAAEAAHGERVNPTLKPSNPAFHGDGRYGAPASATATAPAVPKAPGAASRLLGSADDWKNFASGPADSPYKTLRMTPPSAPSSAPGMAGKAAGVLGKAAGVAQGAVGVYDAYKGIQEGDAQRAGVGAAVAQLANSNAETYGKAASMATAGINSLVINED